MCLGVPGRIVEIDSNGDATVDFWGIKRPVRIETVSEPVHPGDYVLTHVGFAVRRIPEGEVDDTLALYEILLSEAGEDPLAMDVAHDLCPSLV